MPAAITDDQRNRIVYYAALGYTRSDIAEEVGVSRNTVRKYLREARETVESSEGPEETLAAMVRGDHDWESQRRTVTSFSEHPM
jgi:predicted transcriptional regulator